MEAMIRAQPEVTTAEMWTWVQAKVRRPDVAGAASEYDAELRGVPDSSQMFRPTLVLGRTLTPQDEHAVILNHKLATDLNIGLGDRVLVELSGGRETLWTVVGTASDIGVGGLQNSVFMRHSILNADLHQSGRATVAQITTREDTRAAQDRLKKLLQDYFEAQGIGVTLAIGQLENRELASALFGLISGLLQLMTVLMAMVGSIGLSGTLSINVMERRREIGVMRAVGASSGDITLIFAGEGLLLGLLSWALAVPLSMLGAQFFVQTLGVAMNFPLAYRYAPLGVVLWLGIIVVLSLFASWLPARRATQISVRESLAYE
jgi:putative ABC transport system permease protein